MIASQVRASQRLAGSALFTTALVIGAIIGGRAI
jgi:hypothetical protein